MNTIAQNVAKLLTERNLTLSVAESCTGGLLSKCITDVAGASKFYKGGACTYCDEVKHKLLGVRQQTLDNYTAVSAQTACEMAEGAARVFETDLAVSTTGYAGPDGGEDGTPVGTIYIGVYANGTVTAQQIYSPNGRDSARQDTVQQALQMIQNVVKHTEI